MLELKPKLPIKVPRDQRVIENNLKFGIFTHPNLHMSAWRDNTNLGVKYQFKNNFEFEKLYYGYLSCQESSLDIYFMDEYLDSFNDYATYHGPYDRVYVYSSNGFFELKSLVMSERKNLL